MSRAPKKYALLFAALPIGLLVSGCSVSGDAIGYAGIQQVAAGNWTAARASFDADYNTYSGHPIAVFNKGVTYHHDGNIDSADTLFSEAVVRGKGYHPDITLEPEGGREPVVPTLAALTVSEHACNRLHRDNKLDPNCGDRIVAVVEPEAPPAVVAEAEAAPEPAVEAEATVAPPPKRSRH